jgi:dihydroorotate dehydrogenase electron transfer subunit
VPLDVAAEVLSNTHLSNDYNVLALKAPDIAERVLPGQFVMVKTGDRCEPILRRPFSVFEVLEEGGRIAGLSLLSKRIGRSTKLLFARLLLWHRPIRRGWWPGAWVSRLSPRLQRH